ncbi:helix-turn-helix domain-containing protein [Amycolatopsis sp. NPDC049688]|uniref:helix-turn-helix domain-containing protein n=1 Tax=Amycolatopsis sp. NPDC049688 TaxID=3154733 RepID=UPI003424880F
MARARPITDEDKRRVRDLHAAGESRNAIAEAIGRSGATVSKIAAELGLSFDREAVKAATEAKVADARARRAALMLDLLDDAARLRAQLWTPHTYVDHGGKDFVREVWTQPEPTAQDKLKLMQATATAANTSMKLEEHDTGSGGVDGAKSMLGALAAGLQAAYDQLPPDDAGA